MDLLTKNLGCNFKLSKCISKYLQNWGADLSNIKSNHRIVNLKKIGAQDLNGADQLVTIYCLTKVRPNYNFYSKQEQINKVKLRYLLVNGVTSAQNVLSCFG